MKNKSPLISVYITNYNYANYIQQSIESVLNQTEQDFELLIIDDGSTDKSKEIIETYTSHEKIKIIYQQNKGLNVSNNIAIRASAGKYLMRLDADDFLHQSALEILSGVLENNDEMGLVFPDYYLVDNKGNITEQFQRHNFNDEVSLLDQAAHGACTMIRKEFLKALGGYNESFSCQDGYDIWLKFTARYKVTNVNQPLFYYRQHGNNLTRNEAKILSTRANMNEFYAYDRFGTLKSLCIIPVRDSSLALRLLNGKPVIDYAIHTALQCNNVKKIIISSPDVSLRKYVTDKFVKHKNIILHERDEKEARLNIDLVPTVESILKKTGTGYQAITVINIAYPFIQPIDIDNAIHTMFIFNTDSIISVRQEDNRLFQHNGGGLVPIMGQEKFAKLERESLYKLSGGITAVRLERFLEKKKITFGKIGHIMIGQLAAMGLFTEFDFQLAENILQKKLVNQ